MRHRLLLGHLTLAVLAVTGTTAALHLVPVTNPTTVALSYILVILFVASWSPTTVAVVTSLLAMLALNFFFMPPVGTFTIADLHNWVALFTFLVVAIVGSHLSTTARDRTREAVARRNELSRLFDISRDVLLTTDSREAVTSLPHYIARRFDLPAVAICLPADAGWTVYRGGPQPIELSDDVMNRVFSQARGVMEFDARQRTYGGHVITPTVSGGEASVVPVRMGARVVGLMATPPHALEPGTLDALGGVVAIAIERAHFLEERDVAERVKERAEFSSALLASFGHDLRTPLTAIDVAASNLGLAELSPDHRSEQIEVVRSEVRRLTRLFDNILDMARIDAEVLQPENEWVRLADLVDASLSQVAGAVAGRCLEIDTDDRWEVHVDPRLTSTALAHLIENAARYSPPESPIRVRAWVEGPSARIAVSDEGPGVAPQDLPHVFERFYRGSGSARYLPGSGMGLAITRGLLAAEGAVVWAENRAGRGAEFTISLAGPMRPAETSHREGDA